MKRSYEITTNAGGIIYKYMEPSKMQLISGDPEVRKRLGWASIKLVGDSNIFVNDTPKPKVEKNRPDWGFLTSYNKGTDPRRR